MNCCSQCDTVYASCCATTDSGYISAPRCFAGCYTCPSGSAAVNSVYVCQVCSPGSYSLAGASVCTTCPNGTLSGASGVEMSSNFDRAAYRNSVKCLDPDADLAEFFPHSSGPEILHNLERFFLAFFFIRVTVQNRCNAEIRGHCFF